jgi:hypothetical protein
LSYAGEPVAVLLNLTEKKQKRVGWPRRPWLQEQQRMVAPRGLEPRTN